jgi:uncharacterized paraquat-inducible protein A
MTTELQNATNVERGISTLDPDNVAARPTTPPDECIHCTRRRTPEHDPDTCARCTVPHYPKRPGNWTGPVRHKSDPRIVW